MAAVPKRRVERRCELHRVAIALHMHVHCEGLIAQQMIVQCGHVNAARSELCRNRGDLVHGQHEVTHHHALIAHLLKGEPAAERKAGFQFDAIQSDLEVGSREAHAVDATWRRRTGLSKSLADLRLPVIGSNGKNRRSS